MIIVELIILYLFNTIAISNLTKIKFEKSLIITTGAIYIILYLTGICSILNIGVSIIYLCTIISIIYSIYCFIKKKNIKEFLKPSLVFWIFLILILYLFCYGTDLSVWDEFSHWGTNLKAMYYYNALWASKLWDGVHVVYPPLSGIVEYLGIKLYGEYSAWIAYFALDVFMLNFFIIIFSKFENKLIDYVKGFITIICLFSVIYIFNFILTSLYIDLALGILFFIGLYVSLQEYNKENKIMLAIILFLLPMMKDSGLILSAIILISYFTKIFIIPVWKNKKITSQDISKLKFICLLLLVIFSCYFSWKGYLSYNNHVLDYQHDGNSLDSFNIVDYLESVFLITTDSKNSDIATSFYNYLNSGEIIGKYPFKTIIQIIIVLNIIGIIIYKKSKSIQLKDRIISIIVALDLGAILYFMFLLVVYLFVFTEREGRSLASIERYSSTFFIAFVFLIIALCCENKKNITIYLLFLICMYGMNVTALINPITEQTSPINDKILADADVISEYVNEGEKVYIVMQDNNGLDFHELRYLIAPIKTNLLYEWNVGTENAALASFTIKITKEEWIAKLIAENYDYIYLSNTNDGFLNLYGDMFADNYSNIDLDKSLYKINVVNNSIQLEKVN